MSTELTADGKAIRSYNEAHAHPTYADYVWRDRALAAVAEERSKREAATNACHKLITEHTQRQRERDEARAAVASVRAEAATRQERLSMALLAAEAENARLRQLLKLSKEIVDYVAETLPMRNCDPDEPSSFPLMRCWVSASMVMAARDIQLALAPPAQPAAAPAATEPPTDEFRQYLKENSAIVAAWPDWMKAGAYGRRILTPQQVHDKAQAIMQNAEKERNEAAERDTSAWRECVAAEVAGGTYDLVPEPEPAAMDPALREPLTVDFTYTRSVKLDTANARIAALVQEIDRLQADLAEAAKAINHDRKALAKIIQKRDAHIAGEPARTRAAVVAELRRAGDLFFQKAADLRKAISEASIIALGWEAAGRYCHVRADELEREAAKEGGDAAN